MNDFDLELLRLHARGYCCSQILVLLGLGLQGAENPGLVRAAMGLCSGLGQGSETCGVLTGAACLVGYHAGKGADSETAHEHLPLMLSELSDWFREAATAACPGCAGTRCEDILGGPGGRPEPARCGGLVQAAFAKVLEILQAEGIDPTESRDAGA